jgi:hypothetical protein
MGVDYKYVTKDLLHIVAFSRKVASMIEHTQNGNQHQVTPLTEQAARFLNTFVGRTITMSNKEWESVQMEMGGHNVWVVEKRGENTMTAHKVWVMAQ